MTHKIVNFSSNLSLLKVISLMNDFFADSPDQGIFHGEIKDSG